MQNRPPTPSSSPLSAFADKAHENVFYLDNYRLNESSSPSSQLSEELVGARNNGCDDVNFCLIYKEGDMLNGQFVITKQSPVGAGVFSQVVAVNDTKNNEEKVMKIVKSNLAHVATGTKEVLLHTKIRSLDFPGKNHIAICTESFEHLGHICMVFNAAKCDLRQHLLSIEKKAIDFLKVQHVARQLLDGLAFLSNSEVAIIHCDLKPDNILVFDDLLTVKISDFGLAQFKSEECRKVVQSRFYRAPEVLLGGLYDEKIDVWSLACILLELYIGKPLFPAICRKDLFLRYGQYFGVPPAHMITSSNYSSDFFKQRTNGKYSFLPLKTKQTDAAGNETTKKFVYPQKKRSSFYKMIKKASFACGTAGELWGVSTDDVLKFLNVMDRMLVYDPTERLSAQEAVQSSLI